MHKKASMELSVNSIVILVIAVVMMGLILAFIKYQYDRLHIVAPEPDPQAPTASDPVTISADKKIIIKGDSGAIKMAVYNNNDAAKDYSPDFSCNPLIPTDDDSVKILKPTKRSVGSYGSTTFTFSIETTKAATPTTYLCTLMSKLGTTSTLVGAKDFVLTVQS